MSQINMQLVKGKVIKYKSLNFINNKTTKKKFQKKKK